MPLPKIVIVGRPNVGKSSLLNMLAGRRVSIVDPTAGVTRDRINIPIEIPAAKRDGKPHAAELIDTGGYGIEDSMNLTSDVEQQISLGLAEADLILFAIDAQQGLVTLDYTTADVLRKSRGSGKNAKPVLLLANKVDAENHEAGAFEANALGFGEPVLVSAKTGYGKSELHRMIRNKINFEFFEEWSQEQGHAAGLPEAGPLIAIVGKRNAGKSTLVNALAGDERVIVSEQAGTTRDSVDVRFEIEGVPFTAIDTAGVRKTKSLDGDIEFYSQHRSLRSVRRADVCLLIIDAAVPISQVDKQLVNEILKHHKPTVICVNKWDLAEEDYTQEEYVEYMDDALKGLDFAPIVFISAQKAEGIKDALSMAANLKEQSEHRISTGQLNNALEAILAERGPSSKSGKRAKIYYCTQTTTNPPTIAVFVNDPDIFDNNYQRFLMNRFRDVLPFSEVPIRLLIRGKEKLSAEDRKAMRKAQDS